ncbi:hypothetical protein H8S95_01015 [Pontibacter sp. KCTC 32443]|uniref:hypothetical protein n=1 Tax=Pontibacter TaxID=323449 RepID=UPI00164E642B|nr:MULTISPECIES: hypothetical protein [Pontibacter]MBC5772627.1 hypothetical protein [Pontibacter sp. KCTC 32443]
MKNSKLIILCLTAFLVSLFNLSLAQTVTLSQLDIQRVAVAKNTGTTTGTKFYLNGTPSGLVSALGSALSVTTEYSEMNEVNQTVYKFNGAEFTFEGNTLVDFHISNSNYYVIINNIVDSTNPFKYYFKVGDSLSRLSTLHSGSYNAKEEKRLFFQIYRTETTYVEEFGKIKPVTKKILLDNALLFEHNSGVITGFYF